MLIVSIVGNPSHADTHGVGILAPRSPEIRAGPASARACCGLVKRASTSEAAASAPLLNGEVVPKARMQSLPPPSTPCSVAELSRAWRARIPWSAATSIHSQVFSPR